MNDLESLFSKTVDYIVFHFLKIRDNLIFFISDLFNFELTFHNLLLILLSFVTFAVAASFMYVIMKNKRKKLKEPVLETTIPAEPRARFEMARETLLEGGSAPVEHEDMEEQAVVVCKKCGHLVPRTLMCLYCGAPIRAQEDGF